MINILDILKRVVEKEGSAFFYTPPIYENAQCYLFENPCEQVSAKNSSEIENSLSKIDEYLSEGFYAAGSIAYEAGYCFEERLREKMQTDSQSPMLSFAIYKPEDMRVIDTSEISFDGVEKILEEKNFTLSNSRLNVTQNEYVNSIKKIKNFIREGDTYQVNYTVKQKFKFEGDVGAFFLSLIFNQSAKYAAIINDCSNFVISISPELFFVVEDGDIITSPMKGTAPRGKKSAEDARIISALKGSAKNAAENVMIVDLLRNDFGKISDIDTVKVPELYKIQKYESVFQMVSSVTSELTTDKFSEIIKNVFPCGSVTGAPKIRTMEIINELEKEPRGIYTGAVGLMLKDKWIFNVAIRTTVINKDSNQGEVGVGSGVVWESDPVEEYNEVHLKGKFLTTPDPYFELFETCLVEDGNILLKDFHFERLKKAAEYFLFLFDIVKLEAEIESALIHVEAAKRYKLKFLLTKWGDVKTEIEKFAPSETPVKIAISEKRIDAENKFQYFKTTNRKLYDTELSIFKKQGFGEGLFLNKDGHLGEGAISNLFIRKGDKWFTPPIEVGILNGCYRRFLLEIWDDTSEKILIESDLIECDEIILTNSLRKIIRVESIYKNGELLREL